MPYGGTAYNLSVRPTRLTDGFSSGDYKPTHSLTVAVREEPPWVSMGRRVSYHAPLAWRTYYGLTPPFSRQIRDWNCGHAGSGAGSGARRARPDSSRVHRLRRSGDRFIQLDQVLSEHRSGCVLRHIYEGNLERAKGLVPGAATYLDYRRLLDDDSIDAVVIATPAASSRRAFLCFDRRGQARLSGEDDYGVHHRPRGSKDACGNFQKTTAESIRCRSGIKAALPATWDRRAAVVERSGKSSARSPRLIWQHSTGTTPHGKPQWLRTARITADMNPENILWKSFLGRCACA